MAVIVLGDINLYTGNPAEVDEIYSTPQLYKSTLISPLTESQVIHYTDALPWYDEDDVFWNPYNQDVTYGFTVVSPIVVTVDPNPTNAGSVATVSMVSTVPTEYQLSTVNITGTSSYNFGLREVDGSHYYIRTDNSVSPNRAIVMKSIDNCETFNEHYVYTYSRVSEYAWSFWVMSDTHFIFGSEINNQTALVVDYNNGVVTTSVVGSGFGYNSVQDIKQLSNGTIVASVLCNRQATFDVIWISTDNGLSFSKAIGTAVSSDVLYSGVLTITSTGIVLVGCNNISNSAIMISDDNGLTFRSHSFSSTSTQSHTVCGEYSDGTLYAMSFALAGGLIDYYESSDLGISWQQVSKTIGTHHTYGQTYLIGGVSYLCGNVGIYTTTDNGNSWEVLKNTSGIYVTSATPDTGFTQISNPYYLNASATYTLEQDSVEVASGIASGGVASEDLVATLLDNNTQLQYIVDSVPSNIVTWLVNEASGLSTIKKLLLLEGAKMNIKKTIKGTAFGGSGQKKVSPKLTSIMSTAAGTIDVRYPGDDAGDYTTLTLTTDGVFYPIGEIVEVDVDNSTVDLSLVVFGTDDDTTEVSIY